jgi:hypothetical protein
LGGGGVTADRSGFPMWFLMIGWAVAVLVVVTLLIF